MLWPRMALYSGKFDLTALSVRLDSFAFLNLLPCKVELVLVKININ